MSDAPQDFEAMKTRLDEIAEEVSVEGISLDDALALYEEAVKLGLAACDVSEADILVPEEEPEDTASPEGEVPAVAEAVAVAEAAEAAEVVEAVEVAEAAAAAEETDV